MDTIHMFYTATASRFNKEYCEICGDRELDVCCDKCGDGVCRNERCCMVFPHYHNSEYVLCDNCKNKIESKLKQVDFSQLTLLKRKIAAKKTIKTLPISTNIESANGRYNGQNK